MMHRPIIAVVFILTTAAVLGGIAAAVYFTWPDDTEVHVRKSPAPNLETSDSHESTLPYTTTFLFSFVVRLSGNFTILNRTIENTDNSSICTYMTAILSNSKLKTSDCTIVDMSPGSVRVRYNLDIVATTSTDVVLRNASSAIAWNSSDYEVFLINQSSITFEDKNGVVQNFCTSKTLCSDANSICISVIGGYECVCLTGFSQTAQGCVKAKGRFCKPTNTWIPTNKVCDKYQDCSDDTDEVNCTCDTKSHYGCLSGRCIYHEWLCDGIKDCPQGDDERPPQCNDCKSDQFQCRTTRDCVSSIARCDGISGCEDSSDESHCISSVNDTGSGLLNATYRGLSNYYICSDGWNASWSNSVCKQMGYGMAVATSSQSVSGSFLSLDGASQSSSSNIMAYLNISNCASQNAVNVNCANLECGRRAVPSDSVGPYILNGQRAAKGAWPWQVIVFTGYVKGIEFVPMTLCGGSLISDRWILTAAHCATITNPSKEIPYTGPTRPENLLIVLGTISLLDNPDAINMNVDQVYVHPKYVSEDIDNDVALLRLSHPVTLGQTVQPVCLPDKNEDLSRFRVCVDTGFGRTLRNAISNDLLQARMNIMPGSYCRMYNTFLRTETQLCIGTLSNDQPDINICLGDSGGPLSCQDENGAWMVVGVNSYVLGNGQSSGPSKDICLLSVVARVTAFLDWFNTIMTTNSI